MKKKKTPGSLASRGLGSRLDLARTPLRGVWAGRCLTVGRSYKTLLPDLAVSPGRRQAWLREKVPRQRAARAALMLLDMCTRM